ncbi:MAG: hypothetical protein A3H28_10955 [Acidobacteria bacterium RIFCSPLOWO2_02_FULL_61_28]|nr:MAG: hypothetical protein A3H28_10955 [Acidobacteria bacterium RIFCSPLOWO2_02_FULL_61_28]
MKRLLRLNGLRTTAPVRSLRLRSGQAGQARLGRTVVLLIWYALLAAPGYGGAIQRTPLGLAKRWRPNTPIPYVVNPGGVPGFTGELQRLVVVGAIDDSFRAWTEIPGAAIVFTNAGVSSQTNAAVDGTSLISFQDTAFQFSPGVLGVALVVSATAPGPTQVGSRVINAEFEGQILDVDIVFNPRPPGNTPFSPVGANNTIDLVSVAIHEVGHLLGLDHTGVFSSIMNPFSESGAGIASRILQLDDTVTAASLYPAATFAADRGTIAGLISSSTGARVKSAHVIAVSTTGGVPVASQLSGPDGSYEIKGLPPGSYRILVEPLDGPISLGNFPGFYADGSANFASTFFGGLTTPALATVIAGQTFVPSADVTLPARPADILNIDALGTSTQTPTGTSFLFGAAPLFLPRGRSYQVFVTGPNQTSDTNLTQTGAGITGGATTGASLPNGQPIRQQTVTLSATATLGPSNLSLSNSGSASFFPGGLVATVNPSISPPVREGAGFTSNVTPGAIVSIFGTDLALGRGPQGTELAVATPLPTSMGGVSVKVGDRFAPLFFVSPTQINAMIPFEITGASADITVVTGPNAAGNTVTASLSPTAPGIFFVNLEGRQQGAILNGSDNTLTVPAGSPLGHPARPGEVVVIFASGLGPVSPVLPSGLAAGAGGTTIPTLTTPPRVLIGGQQATIQFAGLAPGFVGLYQVNAVVPSNTAANPAVPVQITTAQGQTSNLVTIAVSP